MLHWHLNPTMSNFLIVYVSSIMMIGDIAIIKCTLVSACRLKQK